MHVWHVPCFDFTVRYSFYIIDLQAGMAKGWKIPSHPELGHISCFSARCNILFIHCYCKILDSFISMRIFHRLEKTLSGSFTIHNWNVHMRKIKNSRFLPPSFRLPLPLYLIRRQLCEIKRINLSASMGYTFNNVSVHCFRHFFSHFFANTKSSTWAKFQVFVWGEMSRRQRTRLNKTTLNK